MRLVWKFLLPAGRFHPDPDHPGIEVHGPCVAVAIAETEGEARRILAADNGHMKWIEIAQVTAYECDTSRVVTILV